MIRKLIKNLLIGIASIILATAILGLTVVLVYGFSTDCKGTSGLYVYCAPNN